jgi:quercetin dioxygenase-like cupin family protein
LDGLRDILDCRSYLPKEGAMATQTKARPTRADPIAVDPKHYKVELENDQVRVLRISYGPGERSVMHGHPASVAVCLTDCHVRFTMPDGKTEEMRAKAGESMMTPAGDHLPENLGSKRIELMLIELKNSPAAR